MKMTSSKQLQVLVVDDQEDIVFLLVRMLKMVSVPIEVTTCLDGTSALNLIAANQYDCLLLDYDLPDMTGVDILREALKINPDQAVVMVTARGSEELAVETMKLGATDYLVKGHLSREALDRLIFHIQERNALHSRLREQEKNLIDAERQRVMMESVGATCHHFSQPITSLLGRLEILIQSNPPLSEKQLLLLKDCYDCTLKMSDLLNQFQRVRSYRTVPYTENTVILDIG
jgi:DNA-binding response OmpR family regulator